MLVLADTRAESRFDSNVLGEQIPEHRHARLPRRLALLLSAPVKAEDAIEGFLDVQHPFAVDDDLGRRVRGEDELVDRNFWKDHGLDQEEVVATPAVDVSISRLRL